MQKFISMADCPNPDLVVAVLQCLTKICNAFPRDFLLNGNNQTLIFEQIPLFLNSAFPQIQQEALELAATLLTNSAKTDLLLQRQAGDAIIGKNFLTPFVALANTSITQPGLLTAMVHLAQSIGMYCPKGHPLTVQVSLLIYT